MLSKLLKLSAFLLLALFIGFTSVKAASVLFPYQGGTGTSTPPVYGQVLVGNSSGTYTLTATSSLGISGSGTGVGTVSTSSLETQGYVPYWTTTNGYPAKLGSIASSSLSTGTGLTLTGTLGALIGGTNATIGCATANSSTFGCLSSTDWNLFNQKVSSSSLTASIAAAYPFQLSGNATSTLTQFNGGLTAYASSTIGNGTQAGGLTVNGGATTTGNAYFAGNVGVDTKTAKAPLDVHATQGVASDLVALENTGANWAIGIGNEGIGSLYIGCSIYSCGNDSGYFWRANWSTPGEAGNTFQDANAGYNGTAVEILQHGSGNTGDYLHITTSGGTSGNIFDVANSGNVGLSTTTPASTLSVQGNGLLSGNLSVAGLTATGTVALTNYTSGALAVNSSGIAYTFSTSTWTFASSTLLSDSNTWSGTNNFGTIGAGTWNGSVIGSTYGGAGTVSGILKANGSGTVSAASNGTDYTLITAITCTNQFISALSSSGAATCATVGASDVSLANLSATNSTLTFSGTYNGSTARTVGINLGNANTWTATSTFSIGLKVGTAGALYSNSGTTTVQDTNGVNIGNGSHGIHIIPGSSTTTLMFY